MNRSGMADVQAYLPLLSVAKKRQMQRLVSGQLFLANNQGDDADVLPPLPKFVLVLCSRLGNTGISLK